MLNEMWIRSKAKEMLKLQDQLYSGAISGREYQDKTQMITNAVKLKEGEVGLELFRTVYKELLDARVNKEV